MGGKITFRKFYRTLYVLLIFLVIILGFLYNPPSSNNSSQKNTLKSTPNSSQKTSGTVNKSTSKAQEESLTDLIVKPIITDPINSRLFRVVFYLIIIVGLSLLIPAGLFSLRKFKFFSYEFEVVEKEEVQSSIVDLVEIYEGKSEYMNYLSSDTTHDTLLNEYLDSNEKVKLLDALDYFIEEMKVNYATNFKKKFDWFISEVGQNGIFMTAPPTHVSAKGMHAIKTAVQQESLEVVNDSSKYFKTHYLIYPFKYMNKKYVIVLYDHKIGFDKVDQSILENLYKIVKTSSDGIEYSLMSKKYYNILRRNDLI
jgi:hypothetical protein